MHLEISTEDAQFLHEQLLRQIQRIEDELMHTEQRGLKQVIAADARRLRRLVEQIAPR